MKRIALFSCLLFPLGMLTSCAQEPKQTKSAKKNAYGDEVGSVKWLRDHDAALAKAKKENKPVFLFFQEVPG